MADLLPETMHRHRHVIDTAREVCGRFGFRAMATPIVEFTEVFARPLGASSDVVQKEMYTFQDRKGESLTLRPEATASVVRALISNGLTQTLPQKFFYEGPMFRYERPQKGRMRQFHQIGVELLGADRVAADADVIIMADMILKQLGVADKTTLYINTLGDGESRKRYSAALVAYLKQYEGELSPDSKTRLANNPLRILDSKDAGDQKLLADAPVMDAYLTGVAKGRFGELELMLEAMKIKYAINRQLVRGLDYYNDTVFEFTTDALGAQGAVVAGGRYNGLAELLGSKTPIPGIGWAAGVERLAELISPPSLPKPDCLMIGMNRDQRTRLLPPANALRDKGLVVETAYADKLAHALKEADRKEVKLVVIIGEDEMAKNTALIRNMADGKQSEVAQADLARVVMQKIKEIGKHG